MDESSINIKEKYSDFDVYLYAKQKDTCKSIIVLSPIKVHATSLSKAEELARNKYEKYIGSKEYNHEYPELSNLEFKLLKVTDEIGKIIFNGLKNTEFQESDLKVYKVLNSCFIIDYNDECMAYTENYEINAYNLVDAMLIGLKKSDDSRHNHFYNIHRLDEIKDEDNNILFKKKK